MVLRSRSSGVSSSRVGVEELLSASTYAWRVAGLLVARARRVQRAGRRRWARSRSPRPSRRRSSASRARQLFETAFAGTNGRSCATCHVREEHTGLTPAHVAATLAANPADPLFNRIDADDPLAAVPTYEHLKKGLVRVVLTLPDNMDLLDPFAGNRDTPPDRTIAVWRAVPTVENTRHHGALPVRRSQGDAAGAGAGRDHRPQPGRHGGAGGSGRDRRVPAGAVHLEPRARRWRRSSRRACPSSRSSGPSCRWTSSPPRRHAGSTSTTRPARPATAARRPIGSSTARFTTSRSPSSSPTEANVLFDTSVTPPVPVRANQPNNEFLNIGHREPLRPRTVRVPGDLQLQRPAAAVPLPLLHRRDADGREGRSAARPAVRSGHVPAARSTRTARRSSVRTSCRSSSRPTRGAPPSPATRTTSRRSTCPRCAASPTRRRTSTTTPPRRCATSSTSTAASSCSSSRC